MIERYVGFRGTLAGGFTYQARIGSATYHGAALYENDWASGRDFKVVYEEKLQAVQARGEIGYARAERFSFRAALAWNGFNSQETEDRAWGLLPLDIDGHLRWQIVSLERQARWREDAAGMFGAPQRPATKPSGQTGGG
jgi:hypothetical protein